MYEGYEGVLWALLLIACVTDLVWGKIFNVVTFTFILGGLAFRFWAGGLPSFLESFSAVVLIFLVSFPLYWLKAFAAGDVKLLMAVGAWSNFGFSIRLGLISVLVGAIVGILLLWRERGVKGGVLNVIRHFGLAKAKNSTRMPFGPAFLSALLILKISEINHWSFIESFPGGLL